MAYTQDGNQGSFASKMFQNDASRKDGDWICPYCGNMNISFGTVCNGVHCGAPKPSATPPAPVRNSLPFYYGGVDTPPPQSMPSMFGSQIPHSGVPYDYGLNARPRVPYSPISPFPPGSYGGVVNNYGGDNKNYSVAKINSGGNSGNRYNHYTYDNHSGNFINNCGTFTGNGNGGSIDGNFDASRRNYY